MRRILIYERYHDNLHYVRFIFTSYSFIQGFDLVRIRQIHQFVVRWKYRFLVICIEQFCHLINSVVIKLSLVAMFDPLLRHWSMLQSWACWWFKLSRHSLVPSVSLACSHGEHRSRVFAKVHSRESSGFLIIDKDIRGVKFRFCGRWEEKRWLLTPGTSRVRLNETPPRIIRKYSVLFSPILSSSASVPPLFTPLFTPVRRRSRVHDPRTFRNYLENGHGRPFLETGPGLDMHRRARGRQRWAICFKFNHDGTRFPRSHCDFLRDNKHVEESIRGKCMYAA